jgi:hypothetical protein
MRALVHELTSRAFPWFSLRLMPNAPEARLTDKAAEEFQHTFTYERTSGIQAQDV